MPSVLGSTLLALASAASVSAHGYVSGVQNEGGSFETGWLVSYAYNPTPPKSFGWTEAALDLGFVSPAAINGPDIICHLNATNGALSHTVAAGSTMDVFWSSWPDSHRGPVIDYLAPCNGDCATVDKTTLEFFKIDEAGLDNGVWASDTLIKNNASWPVTIPSTIKPGNYVLRHEIIALHGGGSENGAQLYPFCLNLEVTGTGTEVPAGTLGEKLYTSKDPGILVNIYVDDLVYEIPGPALYGSGSSVPSSNTTTPAVTSAVESAVPVATSAVSSVAESMTSVSVAAVASVAPTTLATMVRSTSSAEAVATEAPVADDEEDC